MPTINIFIFIIVAIFVVCADVPIIPRYEFNVEKYLGTWYEIGRITPLDADPYSDTCGRYEITKAKRGNNSFDEVYKFRVSKYMFHYTGYGQIVNSEMNVTIPILRQVNSTYTVEGYNNDTELIINKKDEKKYYELLSRVPAISEGTGALFDRLAAAVGMEALYVSHSNCSYDSEMFFE